MPPSGSEDSLQTRIESIYRASPAGMGIVADRILVEVNEKLCAMTGYSSAELLGQSSRVLYPSEEEFEKVGTSGFHDIEHRGITTMETRWRRKDGSIIDVLVSSSPISLGNAG
jgi:PAS domain S-box-containing protein